METKNQAIVINSREILICDSVTDVAALTEDFVEINTTFGKIDVEGEGLKIKELNEKEGKIVILGKIIGVFFKEEKDGKGFFKKHK